MKVYISGIAGTGMGPLALMAHNAGIEVCGSDLGKGAIYDELIAAGIDVYIGEQDGEFLRSQLEGLDWFVYTSALPQDSPELLIAREAGVKVSKRDDFTAWLVGELGLKMVAVAGTHGKTTTTAMIIWAALKYGLPVSYVVGTTLGFAASGAHNNGDEFFIYEADEYDRNFLKFHPWLAVITSVSYDHPDIYPSREDYKMAFEQFKKQSEIVIESTLDGQILPGGVMEQSLNAINEAEFRLAGVARRADARMALAALCDMWSQHGRGIPHKELVDNFTAILNEFPGVGRRFERLWDGVYTDYAHHPEEIAATIEIAREQAEIDGKKRVVVVYEPHQNTRQHEVMGGYPEAFRMADKVYWLPTYLTRENPELEILRPEDFVRGLSDKVEAETVNLDAELMKKIREHSEAGDLVVLMTAGPADTWLRKNLV